jgi:hypothetical protein
MVEAMRPNTKKDNKMTEYQQMLELKEKHPQLPIEEMWKQVCYEVGMAYDGRIRDGIQIDWLERAIARKLEEAENG